MSTTATKTVAIFGATGGTGLATLKLALQAGNTVNVLARTPSKLSDLASQNPNLHIIQGDIRDVDSIKPALVVNNRVVDVVISAIGMVMERKGLGFTSADPTICHDGTQTILSALDALEAEADSIEVPVGGPEMVLLSTTGISRRGRDIPVAMLPLYHWVLQVPHADKLNMETLMIEGQGRRRRWVLVRPSFLGDGKSKGLAKVKVSTEIPGATEDREEMRKNNDVAIGYAIYREDVALWIVEECVKRNAERWIGRMVTLTY
ncbi:short-chain dehydrogenase [Phlyctema vagabunda]|uniref:Short-chain dehydrogenase n=1 Tax=Phlyctema vagabunda TaxID=108571 RepID=A0ABR4PFY1_9HELO